MWRSWLAHLVWDQRVESSSLFTPTIRKDNILSDKHLQICRCLLFTIPAGARRQRQLPHIILAKGRVLPPFRPSPSARRQRHHPHIVLAEGFAAVPPVSQRAKTTSPPSHRPHEGFRRRPALFRRAKTTSAPSHRPRGRVRHRPALFRRAKTTSPPPHRPRGRVLPPYSPFPAREDNVSSPTSSSWKMMLTENRLKVVRNTEKQRC